MNATVSKRVPIIGTCRGKKNLEAAPRIIFATFHRFSSLFADFAVFPPFFILFIVFFTAFPWIFEDIFWVPHFCQDRIGAAPQDWETPEGEVRDGRHFILAKKQNPETLDSAFSQDRMGAAPQPWETPDDKVREITQKWTQDHNINSMPHV